MPRLMQNKIKWKADLMVIWETTDRNDRPEELRVKKRDLFYSEIGINAQEKYFSKQSKTSVVRRIKIRWDGSITEKFNAVRISGVDYNITRIYTNMDKREMELSLAYVS